MAWWERSRVRTKLSLLPGLGVAEELTPPEGDPTDANPTPGRTPVKASLGPAGSASGPTEPRPGSARTVDPAWNLSRGKRRHCPPGQRLDLAHRKLNPQPRRSCPHGRLVAWHRDHPGAGPTSRGRPAGAQPTPGGPAPQQESDPPWWGTPPPVGLGERLPRTLPLEYQRPRPLVGRVEPGVVRALTLEEAPHNRIRPG